MQLPLLPPLAPLLATIKILADYSFCVRYPVLEQALQGETFYTVELPRVLDRACTALYSQHREPSVFPRVVHAAANAALRRVASGRDARERRWSEGAREDRGIRAIYLHGPRRVPRRCARQPLEMR